MLTPILFNDNFDLFDRFYEDPWFGFNDHEFRNLEKKLYGHRAKNVMNTDIKEEDDAYEMTIDLPGFKKEEVNVTLENGYLTICAAKNCETKEDNEKAEGNNIHEGYEKRDGNDKKTENSRYIRHERYCGTCERSFYVGDALSVEEIKANFQHGILKLIIPKKDQKELPSKKYVAIEG